ncbi:MAG TPA: RNA polymerase sigma-54 factor [Deltaproteobacteria bacterium]|nr:RNA polymerase sigma-54 factor [Deltaproteobacteria bacterium]
MSYEFKQELKLTQKLLLTPQLRLAIKLLQLSRQELVELVREELEKNPVLEDGRLDVDEVPMPESRTVEVEWQDYLEGLDDYTVRTGLGGIDNSEDDYREGLLERVSSFETTLKEHLMWQLNSSSLNEREKKIGEFIIGNIDEDGYLRMLERGSMDDETYREATVKEIANSIGVSPKEVEYVLDVIQEFTPSGVGAITLRECLLIQIQQKNIDPIAARIVEDHLGLLAKRDYKGIAKSLGVDEETVIRGARLISELLNPVPGAGFGRDEARTIVPDAYVYKVGDEYLVVLNEDGLPKLNISSYYKKLIDNNEFATKEVKEYIRDKFHSAVWLIKSIHQRQRTMKRVVESIVKFQRDFLDRGLRYLKPLVLSDVARDIGMHESTISRVTTNKYVQTPRGIFELKYFFSTGVGSSNGAITPEYVKEKLKEIIEAEDPANPLTDQQIVEKLKECNITVARRTVAKYREELGYLSSSRRKRP